MSSSAFRIRRATIDDLPTLKVMWDSMRIPNTDLDRRLTEFQVAEDAAGNVVGTVGFQILGRHGLIHSEAFSDFGVADHVRPLFWQRIEALVLNHGVARLWTRENTPFWTHSGLVRADEEALQRLPEAWDRSAPGWLTLRLKDEDIIASLEKEFDMFVAAERARTVETVGSAKKFKSGLLTVLLLIFLGGFGYVAYLVISGRLGPGSR
jgi:N-acetylglutamate synthase-like GNAT family acetyltransferase